MNKKNVIIGVIVIALIIGGAIFSKQYIANNTENKAADNTEAIASNADDKTATKEEIVVKVPTIQSGGPLLIAQELGYFKEQNIKLVEVGAVPSGNQLQAVITGDIDFTAGNHADREVEAYVKGIPVKVIIAQSETTKDMPHMKWMVSKDSKINSAKDLVGKKIAMSYITGGCPVTNLREYLRKGGVDIKDVNMIQMNDNMQAAALRQGLIDVATIHAPLSGLLIKQDGARVLFSDYDTFETKAGNNMATTEKVIKDNPEKVRRFVAAVVKAQKWIINNLAETDKIYAKKLDLDPEVAKDFDRMYYSETGLENDERIQLWIDELVKEGEIEEGQVKPTDIYTNEFNPNYKK
ncbi:MAG: ABC transporter substrate-binding protein [Ruminiclostridium sp.]